MVCLWSVNAGALFLPDSFSVAVIGLRAGALATSAWHITPAKSGFTTDLTFHFPSVSRYNPAEPFSNALLVVFFGVYDPRRLYNPPHAYAITQTALCVGESMAGYSAISQEPTEADPMASSTGSLRGRRSVHILGVLKVSY